MRARRVAAVFVASAALVALAFPSMPAAAAALRVGVDAPSVQAAVDAAGNGDVVLVPEGTWPGPVVVDKAIILRGAGGVIDGGGVGTVVRVDAAGARLEGLKIIHSGTDVGRSDACVFLGPGATGAVVRDSELSRCAFGIWVHETEAAEIVGNRISGRPDLRATDRGNGIHLFDGSHLVVRDNVVTDSRDGIYVSATEDSLIADNVCEKQRFGIHYMYSYRNTLRGNVSNHNVVGIALMESLYLVVEDNEASDNDRNGLLFRDVQYSQIRRNRLERNGSGMFFFSSTENVVEDNQIVGNELGMKVWAGTLRNVMEGNRIVGNRQQVFYVGAEDQVWGASGRGNFWGDYLGWDQNGDGVGDRPHRVDSFTARLLYQYPAAIYLLRSPALEMLSHLSDSLPLLRTPTIVDRAPLLREAT